MATRIDPPSLRTKSYELYRQELLAWREVTDLRKDKQGVAIALSLPEDDKAKIREKVFEQISLVDLKKDDGLDILIGFLDKHLKKDDLADSLEKFEEFEDFDRKVGMSITEYIASFDSLYRKIEKLNMKLPMEILAFKLLRKANIGKQEKLLVLTGMNYEHKETLYEEAKKSLQKFKGDITEGQRSSSSAIKLEPAFLAENEEALLAAGYSKQFRGGRKSGVTGRSGYGHGGSQGRQQGRQQYQSRSSTNPTGSDGKILTCRYCGSFRHLVARCPHTSENMGISKVTERMAKVNISEDEHAVLFTGYNKGEISQLGIDARNCAVLDSACSSTVCGEMWLDNYLNSLSQEDKKRVKQTVGHKTFKFGGGERLGSKGEYNLPAMIAGKEVTIRTDVVESDIPLLLSRQAMKTASVKMDLENDTVNIFGQDIALNLTNAGHYCIPIDKAEKITVAEVFSAQVEKMDRNNTYKMLLKLHRQFAHPPMKKLSALLQDAGKWQEEYKDLLEQICKNCDICQRYAKTPPRPAVSLPMASHFNEKVAMDLKKLDNNWILHIIDMWSRYTVSVFIQRKRSSDVLNALMQKWIAIFGIMGSIMTDNGGEFSSDEMREVMSVLNVRVITTAAESPFQNGLCERVHAVTDMMLLKLKEENSNTDSQTLLCWANMARNSLQMWNSYSSHQLVFGQNPCLPGTMTDRLPALEGTTTSEVFAKHLNALHEARKSYIQTEADERIRRALRAKVRAAEQVYEHGDVVYYKRDGKERWLGPATVVFQDGKVIFVRHGGIFVRVSPNRLSKGENLKSLTKMDHSDTEQPDNQTEQDNKVMTDNADLQVSETVPAEEVPAENDTETPVHTGNEERRTDIVQPGTVKINDNIKYKIDDEWVTGTILGRAGKSTGKYKTWYNVRDENNQERSIDLEKVEWEKVLETEINITAASDDMRENIIKAKESELDKLQQFETYEEVTNCGQKTLSTRWVITNKEGKTKARLVVRGFEEQDVEIRKDSPTVGKGAIRMFLSIAALEQWTVKTTDIKSAFLQGKTLERDIHIKPPKESKTPQGIVWKLKHTLYGLKDGARQFYESVKDELLKLGFSQCKLDPAVFYILENRKLRGIICCHVDDFLHAGDHSFEKLMEKLRERFSAGKVEEKTFKYIGFTVQQHSDKVILDHSDYIAKIKNSAVDPRKASDKNGLLNENEQTTYRQLIGQLNWAVQGSRPDMAFELISMSTKLKQGKVSDLVRAIKKISRLKDVKSFMTFPRLDQSYLRIVVFTDASLGNINEGLGSTGAYIVWLMDQTGKCCPIAWNAHKIKRVVRSTLAAEMLSLGEGLEAAFYYRQMLEEILGPEFKTLSIEAYVDNKSVIEAVSSTRMVEDKRLRVDVATIQELLKYQDVTRIHWVPGQLQLANVMTKQGASGFHLLKVLQSGQMLNEIISY